MLILICDDNKPLCNATAFGLGLVGHEAACAHAAAEALSALSAHPFDVVFIDIDLPDMDGWQVAETIRKLRFQPEPRLFAVTARSSREDRRRSAAAGFDRHLTKPVTLAQLWDALAA